MINSAHLVNKDVVWLSYERGTPLPEKMRVEKCISETTGN
jgi:hypothetical protein